MKCEQCDSFGQECLRLGLLADEAELKNEIRDSLSSGCFSFSHLFATILAQFEPSDTISCWNDHLDMFGNDFHHSAREQPIREQYIGDNNHTTYYVLGELQKAL